MGCAVSCVALCKWAHNALLNSVTSTVAREWCAALADGHSRAEERAVNDELNEWMVAMYADNPFLRSIPRERVQKKKRHIVEKRGHMTLHRYRVG